MMTSIKVAIVGSRDFERESLIEELVKCLGPEDFVVSGGARGADTWAEMNAIENGISRIIHEADWNKHGKAAGPIRNALIVKDADVLFAFYTDITNSRGTKNCVGQAVKKVIPVFEFDAKTNQWYYNYEPVEKMDYKEVLEIARWYSAEMEKIEETRVIESTAQRDEGGQ